MTKEFWTLTEITERFSIDRKFLDDLEREEIVCPICGKDPQEKMLSLGEMEKLRLARILFEEMDVNLPGIEVILQMRQNMLNMRKQFDAILEDLALRLKNRLGEHL
jgi:MerR family transcriptional regulator, heat shock protein HspR